MNERMMELLEAFERIRSASYQELTTLLNTLVMESGSDRCTEQQYVVLWEIVRRNEARKRKEGLT